MAVDMRPGDAALDAACGTGKYWPILLGAGLFVTGVDQSEGMLRRLREKFPTPEFPDTTTHQGSLQDLSLSREFDAVICVDAMECVPPEDWPLVLGVFKRHLKAGGWLYLTVEIPEDGQVDAAYQGEAWHVR